MYIMSICVVLFLIFYLLDFLSSSYCWYKRLITLIEYNKVYFIDTNIPWYKQLWLEGWKHLERIIDFYHETASYKGPIILPIWPSLKNTCWSYFLFFGQSTFLCPFMGFLQTGHLYWHLGLEAPFFCASVLVIGSDTEKSTIPKLY